MKLPEIHDGWEWRNLGGVDGLRAACEFMDNLRIPVNEKERSKRQGPYPYYGANGQQGWIDEFIFDEELVLLAEDGGFFFSKTRPASYRVSGKCWVNNHAHVLLPARDVLPDWLNACLAYKDYTPFIPEPVRPKLNQKNAKKIPVPIPPLDEQRRIVARIEELTCRAEEVWRLRMAAAQEVSQMFQVEMKRIFSPQEMDDWVAYESRYVFDIVRGQVDPMDPPYRDLPHVAPDCIESGTGRLLLNRVKTPRELRLASGKYHFKANHVLYSKIRPNLRKVALPSFEGTCSADMYPLIPNSELVTREFLALALLSPSFTQYAVENSDRNAMPKINRPKLFAYKMKLPGKEIQEEITARIREIQTKTDEIHALQVQNERDMAKFQPALLAKAFRGEL